VKLNGGRAKQTLGKDGLGMLEDYRRRLDYWRNNDGMYPKKKDIVGDHDVTRSGVYIASETHYIREIRTIEFITIRIRSDEAMPRNEGTIMVLFFVLLGLGSGVRVIIA
jgi:hypothetical protein